MNLAEELLLLALDPSSGAVSTCYDRLAPALAGAVLGELWLEGHIRLDGKHVVPTGEGAAPADPLIAEAWRETRSTPGPKPIKWWVEHLGKHLRLRERTLASLASHGVLHHEDRTALGIFHFHRYPLDNRGARHEVRERVQHAVSSTFAAARDQALASLAETCGLTRRALTEEGWKQGKDRARRIAKEWPVSAAVLEVAADMDAAIAAATAAITASA